MTTLPPGLLPEGLRDRLPPQADAQARILRAILDCVAGHGYDRVAPPLAEFEEGLAGQLKSATRQDLLRFVDPVSQRTLALRPDITTQVGRIAATRLSGAARPLRLSYGGPVIKLRATQLRPERETLQVGAELIGSDTAQAAREVATIAVEALGKAGAKGITIDLTMPDLVDVLADGPLSVDAARREQLRALLDAKDAGGLEQAGFGEWLVLVSAAGPIDEAFVHLEKLPGSAALNERIARLRVLAAGLNARVTLDPTERHGFAYQSWFGFSLFADGVSGEIGRGGSYTIIHPGGREEAAIGFSLYPDALLDAVKIDASAKSVFLSLDADPRIGARLRSEGWRTVSAISPECDPSALGCTHRLEGGQPVAIQGV